MTGVNRQVSESGKGHSSHQNERQPTRANSHYEDNKYYWARRIYIPDPDAVSGKTIQNEDCIRLVLLGRTGSGKSATGNTILGSKVFESRPSGSSVTDLCKISMGMIEERQVAIVDTPGLFDTNHISNESTKEIIRCMHLSYPGPHAFLLVLKADRFTDEENDTVTSLLDLFGDHMLSYTVVIFTRLDDLEEDGTTLGEYIESSTEALKRLIKSVQFRIIAFNNKGNADQKTSYVSSLHRIINKMQQVNDGKHYTSEMFKEAKSKIQEKIRTAERKKETENQRVFKLVEHKFKSEIRNAERSSSRLQNELCKQKEQHKSIETEHQESQERIVNMQENLSRTKIYNQTELRESIEEENQKVEAKLNARRKQQYRSKPVFTSSWIRNDEQRMKNLADENKMQIRIQKIQLQKQTEEVIRILTYKLKKEREAEVQRQLFQEKRERERIHLQNKNLSNMLNEIEETKRQKELQQRQPNSRRSFFRHSTASPIQTDNVQTTYYENSDDDSSCVIL